MKVSEIGERRVSKERGRDNKGNNKCRSRKKDENKREIVGEKEIKRVGIEVKF